MKQTAIDVNNFLCLLQFKLKLPSLLFEHQETPQYYTAKPKQTYHLKDKKPDPAKPAIVTVDCGSYAPLLHSHVAVGTRQTNLSPQHYVH